ncbi:MAG TPA: alpha/beta fold hydrolase, partial [Polyangiaceae bacterium]|nr:alpha/beta fold hydrolase [Polyangiaceae bacterium]
MNSALRYYRSTECGRLAASDGTELRYLSTGYGDETVVVIPGIEDAVLHFEHVPWFWAWYYRPLAEPGRRVIVLGRGRGLGEQTSTASLAGSYADVIEQQFGRVHVVGISMGGLIAQHLAATRPELVERLALAVTASGVGAGGVAEGERLGELAAQGRWHAFAKESNRICFSGGLRALLVVLLLLLAPFEWLLRMLLVGKGPAQEFRVSARACSGHQGSALLSAITAPALVWGASDDCLFPRASLEEMTRALPNGQLALVAGNHAAFLQERASFHGALHAFFSEAPVPRGRETDVEVAIVGSGFSGLGMAIRLKQQGRGSFLIFEKAASIGGTWRDNDYPGCACDVQSHLYSFSFEQNPLWTRKFARQSEIREYLERCVDKYGLRRHVRVRAEVTRIEFNEQGAFYDVHLSDGTSVTARHVVFGVGALSRPAYPQIEGIEQFAGRAFHSAAWDHTFDFEGKRVAVIGTGASAIQIVPQLAARVSKLSVFQRTPPWVLPKSDRGISELERRLFRAVPLLQTLYRAYIYCSLELRVLGFAIHPGIMHIARWLGKLQIWRQIEDPALRAQVTPSYMPGCKRVLIANDYYPALARPNVELVSERIVKVTERGIMTADGREHELDAIVYGTGFRVSDVLAPLEVIGRGGASLNQVWKTRMEAYLGTAISGFPNFYMLLGPNTGLGHSSMVYMIESQIAYVLDALRTMERSGAARAEVRPEAV